MYCDITIHRGILIHMDTTLVELWSRVLETIKLDLSPTNFQTWFKGTSIEYIDQGNVFISVPTELHRDWIPGKFQKIIIKALRDQDPTIRSVDYIIGHKSHVPKPQPQIKTPQAQLPIGNLYVNREDNLNPRYIFESFIIGPFNEIAFSAAQAVIQKPGAYNPLFIFGQTGVGKTHLMQAIGNTLRKNNPKSKVFYVSSEKFTNDYVDALQKNTVPQFRERYRSFDLLIMDDIQFFSGKEKTQEELFHLFNTLHDRNKQIVFSSDKHPNLIIGLEDRLKSRFGAGMVVDISEPDYESRMAIIRAKQNLLGLQIDSDALDLIAQHTEGSIRELEGLLQTLMNHSTLRGRTITIEDAKNVLKHVVKPRKSASIEEITKTIADYYHIKPELIANATRRKEIVYARQIIMYILREDFNMSFPAIGKALGDRDHTTVMHSYEKVRKDLPDSPTLQSEIETLRSILKTS